MISAFVVPKCVRDTSVFVFSSSQGATAPAGELQHGRWSVSEARNDVVVESSANSFSLREYWRRMVEMRVDRPKANSASSLVAFTVSAPMPAAAVLGCRNVRRVYDRHGHRLPSRAQITGRWRETRAKPGEAP